MTRYHVNPETGDAGVCSAKDGKCPYIHGDSVDVARSLYEKSMSDSLLPEVSRKGVKHDGTAIYVVPEHEIEKARKLIDKANRRLAKLGIDERFAADEETFEQVEEDGYGGKVAKTFIKLRMNTPAISYDGYRFLAVMEKEDEGLVTRAASGVDLHGWRPESQACEHCGQKRHRSKTYLIEDPDGERHQIGSTCVDAYLGMKPEGLWALSYDPMEKLSEDEDYRSSYDKGQYKRPVDDTLGMALAVSDDGRKFVSRSNAEMYGGIATSDDLLEAFDGTKPQLGEWRARMREKAEEYVRNGRVAELKRQIEEMPGGTDYSENLKTIAKGEWCSPRSANTLISILAFDRKKKAKEAEKQSWTSGFAGRPNESVKGMKVKVVRNDVREVYDEYRGDYTNKSRIVMRDEHGHQLIWWASREIGVKDGDDIELKGGKIKKTDRFNDIDQTVLTRVKVEERND